MKALFIILKILKAFNRTPRTLFEMILMSFMHNLFMQEMGPLMKKYGHDIDNDDLDDQADETDNVPDVGEKEN